MSILIPHYQLVFLLFLESNLSFLHYQPCHYFIIHFSFTFLLLTPTIIALFQVVLIFQSLFFSLPLVIIFSPIPLIILFRLLPIAFILQFFTSHLQLTFIYLIQPIFLFPFYLPPLSIIYLIQVTLIFLLQVFIIYHFLFIHLLSFIFLFTLALLLSLIPPISYIPLIF
jgi:hypothetical protein